MYREPPAAAEQAVLVISPHITAFTEAACASFFGFHARDVAITVCTSQGLPAQDALKTKLFMLIFTHHIYHVHRALDKGHMHVRVCMCTSRLALELLVVIALDSCMLFHSAPSIFCCRGSELLTQGGSRSPQ